MQTKLFAYKAWVHVPDCENQLNYITDGMVEVSFSSFEEVELKIRNHLKNLLIGKFFSQLEVKMIPSI